MKLACYDAGTGPRAGVVVDGTVHDATDALGETAVLRDVQALVELSYDAVARLREGALAGGWDLESVRLLPPILRPPAIRDHIAFEEHATRQYTRSVAEVWRRRPIHYYSNPSRLMGHDAAVPMPVTERLDYELEVGAVVGRACSDVVEADWLDVIAGFTIFNDWSARDLQGDEMAYGLGPAKGKDFASSLGPWVVTTDELLPHLAAGVLDAPCTARVNGVVWTESNPREMYHSWGAMVEHASQDSLLLPGDILGSGTVAGGSIGEAIRKGYPARYLAEGDVVELEVAHLGVLRNIIAAPAVRTTPRRYVAHELPPMPEPLPAGAPCRLPVLSP